MMKTSDSKKEHFNDDWSSCPAAPNFACQTPDGPLSGVELIAARSHRLSRPTLYQEQWFVQRRSVGAECRVLARGI